MSFLEFLLLKYSSTMLVCPLMTANMRGVNPDVVGRVKSFRPCNKINIKVARSYLLCAHSRNSLVFTFASPESKAERKTYICIKTKGSEELKIARPASNMEKWGTSWYLDTWYWLWLIYLLCSRNGFYGKLWWKPGSRQSRCSSYRIVQFSGWGMRFGLVVRFGQITKTCNTADNFKLLICFSVFFWKEYLIFWIVSCKIRLMRLLGNNHEH